MKRKPMRMSDYAEHLDRILSASDEELLEGAGSVSHAEAMEKAELEYKKFLLKTLSPVEKAYLKSIKALETAVKKRKQAWPKKD